MWGSDTEIQSVRRGWEYGVGIAIVDATRKRTENRRRHEELEDRHAAVRARCEHESTEQQRCRGEVYDGVLVPFSRVFERMKNVDLAALESMALPEFAELPVIELMRVQLGAAGLFGATIGGLGSGAGMGRRRTPRSAPSQPPRPGPRSPHCLVPQPPTPPWPSSAAVRSRPAAEASLRAAWCWAESSPHLSC
jgi:hypothetical protein